jgi:hypothetical protein
MAASALSMRSALAAGIVGKPAARSSVSPKAAGLKVFARMTKDRVSLKKDSKWRSGIDIYPVRVCAWELWAGGRAERERAPTDG